MTLHLDDAVDHGTVAGPPVVPRPPTRSFAGSWKLVVGLGIVLLFGLLAVAGPWLAPDDPSALGSVMLGPPSAAHWLGTTQTGQDVLSQLLVGARPTLLYGFLAALLATPLSVLVGVTSGYVGGFVDEVLSSVTNVFLVVPLLPLLITVSGYLSRGDRSSYLVLTLIVGCTGWAWGARVLRAQAMAIRASDYIEAARAYGERRWRIITVEMLPNMLSIVASSFLFTVLFAVVLQASLAFLGLVDVTRWSWGTMLYWAQNNDALAAGAWWWFIPPGLCVAILGAGLALANFGVDEVVNPRLRSRAGDREWRSMRRLPAVRSGLTPVLRDTGEQRRIVTLPAAGEPILTVRGLCVRYGHGPDAVRAVENVDLTLHAGEVLGVAGESGSGKSTLAYALGRLLRAPGVITAGEVRYRPDGTGDEVDLLDASVARLRSLRWSEISLVPQSAMRALNPVLTVGAQLFDIFARHRPELRARERRERCVELLRMVNLEPAVLRDYPHQLSGGMRQRVTIAMALALRPKIVIMDEPTSALDVVTQRELLRELVLLRDRLGFSILFITHDLPLLTELADSVAIMYRGRIVEYAPAATLVSAPRHPYTHLLFGSFTAMASTRSLDSGTPRSSTPRPAATGCVFAARCPHVLARCTTDEQALVATGEGPGLVACWRHREITPPTTVRETSARPAADGGAPARPILTAVELTKRYRRQRGRGWTHAVDGVSIELPAASITAVVGETGSGKSTLVRLLAGLIRPTSGTVTLDGNQVRPGRERLRYTESVQLVLQDPFSALNPVHTVRHHLARPLRVHRVVGRHDLTARVDGLLDQVALPSPTSLREQFPYQLSGGQLQRVAIARALAVAPRLLLADEPVSMLDVSVRLGVLNLLGELRERDSMAVLYVTHDITSARYLSDTVAVMYAGRIVERGPTAAVTTAPAHPYTQLLLRMTPALRRDPSQAAATPAGHLAPPAQRPGCPFRSSCPHAMPICGREPPVIEIDTGHVANCWLHTTTSKATFRS